jgi:hypothetical protein
MLLINPIANPNPRLSHPIHATTGVRSGTDWNKLIRLLDLRLRRVVISPYYVDARDDGTPAGKDGRQY